MPRVSVCRTLFFMDEALLATLAAQRGLRLQRSAATDPAVPGYGVYWLLDMQTGLRVWPDRWGAELDEVREWLVFAAKRTL